MVGHRFCAVALAILTQFTALGPVEAARLKEGGAGLLEKMGPLMDERIALLGRVDQFIGSAQGQGGFISTEFTGIRPGFTKQWQSSDLTLFNKIVDTKEGGVNSVNPVDIRKYERDIAGIKLRFHDIKYRHIYIDTSPLGALYIKAFSKVANNKPQAIRSVLLQTIKDSDGAHMSDVMGMFQGNAFLREVDARFFDAYGKMLKSTKGIQSNGINRDFTNTKFSERESCVQGRSYACVAGRSPEWRMAFSLHTVSFRPDDPGAFQIILENNVASGKAEKVIEQGVTHYIDTHPPGEFPGEISQERNGLWRWDSHLGSRSAISDLEEISEQLGENSKKIEALLFEWIQANWVPKGERPDAATAEGKF